MKTLVCCIVGTLAGVALLGLASSPAGVGAEEPDPQPGLDNVTVRLCVESNDSGNTYCDRNEVLATQQSATRAFPVGTGGNPMTLAGTFSFSSSQLESDFPRAVVFGPISGIYQGISQAWLWGSLWRDGTIGEGFFLEEIPTELFVGGLGAPGAGLDFSSTSQYNREYAFQPLAWFGMSAYYVVLYLDATPPGYPGLANPGIGDPDTLDGQVWGWSAAPPNGW